MIISHKYKYVFVGLPLAASTAISKELCEQYDGKAILAKHSIYQDFLKIATEEEKKYRVIACARNPLDISVSYYTKMINDSSGNFSNNKLLRKNGGHLKMRDYKLSKILRENNSSYSDFLSRYYRFPFDNWLSITAPYCSFIIRFENLQEDFENALKHCDISPKRKLPIVNKTKKKVNFESFYNEDNSELSFSIFGPYMLKHSMAFPEMWKEKRVSSYNLFLFKLFGFIRRIYWTKKSYRNTNAQKIYKDLLDKHQ